MLYHTVPGCPEGLSQQPTAHSAQSLVDVTSLLTENHALETLCDIICCVVGAAAVTAAGGVYT
jgi:hypothetical protein